MSTTFAKGRGQQGIPKLLAGTNIKIFRLDSRLCFCQFSFNFILGVTILSQKMFDFSFRKTCNYEQDETEKCLSIKARDVCNDLKRKT